MSKICALTGKTPLKGHRVSHSNRKTIHRQDPNLQKKRLKNPATGKVETILISVRGLRTLAKWKQEGRAYDLRNLRA